MERRQQSCMRAARNTHATAREGSACGLALRHWRGAPAAQSGATPETMARALRLRARGGAVVAAHRTPCKACHFLHAPVSGGHLRAVRLWPASCVGRVWGECARVNEWTWASISSTCQRVDVLSPPGPRVRRVRFASGTAWYLSLLSARLTPCALRLPLSPASYCQ